MRLEAPSPEADLLPGAPLLPESMTANQLARRSRLLAAVVELVAELVDDAVDEDLSMKDIADRAGVALGTVYRYFSSKDHLIAAALLQWAGELGERAARRPPPTGSPSERLVIVLGHALRAYQRQPAFARLLVLVANSADPNASECYAQMGPVVFGALGRSIAEIEPDRRDRILTVVGAVWYHCLVEWTNGRMTVTDVNETLESTAKLLL